VTPAAAPAATLVIFGAMGDLARRLLAPALANLARDGLVGANLSLLGVNRGDGDDESLRNALAEFAGDAAGDEAWAGLRARTFYLAGDFGDSGTFARLRDRLAGIGSAGVGFYLATDPMFFGDIVEALGAAGLLDETQGFRRVVIEKPFGRDLASARALNARLAAVASEKQIYRIDHFLGKETVRNIMVARFGNAFFEAVLNSRYVDHVQITAAETVGVGTRGKFYDATGALRDMVPNHLFQLLAMIGMEPPNSFAAEAVRSEKAKLIEAVRVPSAEEAATDAVRGRYRAGSAGELPLPDYRAESNVATDSRTETYAAVKLFVDSWRWAGVPFYLRTGKALAARDTEIVVVLRPITSALFRDTGAAKPPPNKLIFQIQPDEGITIEFSAKRPGPVVDIAPVSMDFCYADHFDLTRTTGYETLIYDVLIGDQSLFQRADQIEAGWRAVQPLLDLWSSSGEPEDYRAGSDGPAAADALMARDGRQWHQIGSWLP